MNRLIQILLLIFLSTFSAFGQNNEVEMADELRASGKIYIVLIVALIVFVGLTIYVVYVDRSIRKIEGN
jgi:preprotein translocase subunit SecY